MISKNGKWHLVAPNSQPLAICLQIWDQISDSAQILV